MDAEITIKFRAFNLCNGQDLKDMGMTFKEWVSYLIESEGLFGIVEDHFDIVSVEETIDSGY